MKIVFHLTFFLVFISCSTIPDSSIKAVHESNNTIAADKKIQPYSIDSLTSAEINALTKELKLDTFIRCTKELDTPLVSPYTGSVQKLYHHRRDNLDHFIRTLLVADESIKEIRHSKGKIVFNVYSNDSTNYYEEAGFINFSWRYYYGHDIYASFFSYPEIDTVVVLMEDELDTWFPTSGDTDGLRPPFDYMLKKWYAPNVNYLGEGMIDLDNPEHFLDWGHFIVNDSVLEVLLKNN